jgi:hypothetical protein
MSLQEAASAPAESVETSIAETVVDRGPIGSDDKILSIREAARTLAAARNAKRDKDAPVVEAVEQPEPNLAEQAEAAPEENPPSGDTEVEHEPAETPTIEPPVSWTAESKEKFAELPTDVQEYIAGREKARDAEVRRSQNEVAEKQKAYEAEMQSAAQQRQQYEVALPILLQTLQSTGEFADIRSIDDVERLAKDDWPRYVQWDAHQKKVGMIQQEVIAAQNRQAQEAAAGFQQWASEQDRLFAEKVPEFSDPEKGQKLTELAIKALKDDYGFSDNEMVQAWGGAFRDYRMQQVLLDASRYRQLKNNPPKPAAKAVPPVQRPGSARAPGAEQESTVKALDDRLSKTGSLKDAVRLMTARRQMAAR